jgi:hypothetical protein
MAIMMVVMLVMMMVMMVMIILKTTCFVFSIQFPRVLRQ